MFRYYKRKDFKDVSIRFIWEPSRTVSSSVDETVQHGATLKINPFTFDQSVKNIRTENRLDNLTVTLLCTNYLAFDIFI